MSTDRALHRILVEQGHTPTFVPAKERKKRDDEESRNQRELMKWWKCKCASLGVPEILLFSIPNGGGRTSPAVGNILKLEGLRKGAPDLFLAKPMWTRKEWGEIYSGLFLEMKTPTGILSPEQEVFRQRLTEAGYRVEVCRGWQQARDVITNYLK